MASSSMTEDPFPAFQPPQTPVKSSIPGSDILNYYLQGFNYQQQVILIACAVGFILLNATFFRLADVLTRESPSKESPPRPKPSASNPTHLLVVLGSGGHTAEMLNLLTPQKSSLTSAYTHRTYLISSGDAFSAHKAAEFENEMSSSPETYDIVTVRRARRVHQSLVTAPFTSLLCLWDCLQVLRGVHADQQRQSKSQGESPTTSTTKTKSTTPKPTYPDLILTNGPGTGVCIVVASIILLFFGFSGPSRATSPKTPTQTESSQKQKPYKNAGQMRTVFIESWARVQTLSLSGTMLKPFVNRFVVQWPQLVPQGDESGRVEYFGPLVQ